jgi:hypothetical protein
VEDSSLPATFEFLPVTTNNDTGPGGVVPVNRRLAQMMHRCVW